MTILPDMPEPEYHAHAAVSQSGLWTLYRKTPYHFKHRKIEETKTMDLGSAVHIAVLQPDSFEVMVKKGPEDRRGNKWKDIVEECESYGGIPLTTGDYDKCLYMRDNAHKIKEVQALTCGGQMVEHSIFWNDPETGVECRGRIDLFQPKLRMMVDLKTSRCAARWEFEASIGEYGYHVQEPMYSDGWELAGGGPVDASIFIVVENEWPHCAAVYDVKPSAVEEGRAVIRKALNTYSICQQTGIWPGYPEGIQECDIPRYAYRETRPEDFNN